MKRLILVPNSQVEIEVPAGYQYIIDENSSVFTKCDSRIFYKYGLNKKEKKSKKISVKSFDLVKDSTFAEMFKDFERKIKDLSLTRNQIAKYCQKNKKKLNGIRNFFLLKKRRWIFWKEYFVAVVDVYPSGLFVDVYRLEDDDIWGVGLHLRLVIPQLKN
jgi:hypothetical protein